MCKKVDSHWYNPEIIKGNGILSQFNKVQKHIFLHSALSLNKKNKNALHIFVQIWDHSNFIPFLVINPEGITKRKSGS